MPVEITKRLFDVDDYHRMGEAGILREHDRVELIEGEIVTMTPIGPRHNAGVDRAARVLTCCREPRAGAYASVRQLHSGESLAPAALPHCIVTVDSFLAD